MLLKLFLSHAIEKHIATSVVKHWSHMLFV